MNKKFNLGSVILSVICVVFVAEAAAPVAAIGNSQFFWWLFMIIAFLLPYGLISSELGTTYQGRRRTLRLDPSSLPRDPLGSARVLVVLAELPAMDGIVGGDVPRADYDRDRNRNRDYPERPDSVSLRLDRDVDRFLPCLR